MLVRDSRLKDRYRLSLNGLRSIVVPPRRKVPETKIIGEGGFLMNFRQSFQNDVVSQIRSILLKKHLLVSTGAYDGLGLMFECESAAREILRQCHDHIKANLILELTNHVAALPEDWFFDSHSFLALVDAHLTLDVDASLTNEGLTAH